MADATTIPLTFQKSRCGTSYLPPFKAAVDAGAGSLMSAYMDLNDVPASGNPWLLHDVLRDAWKFQGFVVSDAFAVRSLRIHGYARDPQDAAHKAFTAGLNMDMASGTYFKYLPIELQQDTFRICSRSTMPCCRFSKPSFAWDFSNTPTSTNRVSSRR